MTHGYHALSEKEKETLRLLLAGHGAKSAARSLGLSVHTINERLREARRKMEVSSSREAARQLLEFERHIPEKHVDELLWDATSGPPAQIAGVGESAITSRRFAWLAGGTIMTITLALAALAAFSGNPDQAPAAETHAVNAAEDSAIESARQWLALVDANDWTESWTRTGTAFRSLNTQTAWADASQRMRATFGALRSREPIGAEDVPAPPAGYAMVKFRARFANQAEAVERLSLVREGGAWRVVGYTVEADRIELR